MEPARFDHLRITAFPDIDNLSPLMFGQVMRPSCRSFTLGRSGALALMAAMFIGGLINIPVKRIPHKQEVSSNALAVYGLADFWPQTARSTSETVIAVNFGAVWFHLYCRFTRLPILRRSIRVRWCFAWSDA